MTHKEQVLEYLHKRNGEVRDEDGRVSSRIARVLEISATRVSQVLNELETEGKIVRDMPTAKSCTRVALAGDDTVPPLKGAGALAAELAGEMKGALDKALSYMEARHEYETDQLLRQLRNTREELKLLKSQHEETLRVMGEQRKSAERMAGQLEEARLRANRLEHNLDTLKNKSREVMTGLPESERRKLEQLMREYQ